MKILGALLALLSLLVSVAPRAADWFEDYQVEAAKLAEENRIPGFALVYVQQGQAPQYFTFGVTQQGGSGINPQTRFRLASVSKTFTSALMSKLVARDDLYWQTPVPYMAPTVGFNQADNSGLTLEHVLSQSSGYIPNAYDNLIEANYSVTRILNKLADLKPICRPGQCYTYQNALFGVIEHYFNDQKTSYAQELERELLQPLGMQHTSVGRVALTSAEDWAKPHIAIARDRWRLGRVRNDYYRFPAAAGINASIQDLSIWLEAMLGSQPEVLSDDTVDELVRPRVRAKRELNRRDWRDMITDAHYGLGWKVYQLGEDSLAYHGGWVQGYRSEVAFSRDYGAGFAVLMNAESNAINKMTASFWRHYLQHAHLQLAQVENASPSD